MLTLQVICKYFRTLGIHVEQYSTVKPLLE